ncbi:hypothetical protein [uncultured Sphingosinicella sp.]|jgi:hypothetical protein|uniref:hypothetical protein n=1 Tax=uncultured Sphingosinicella sp. TaxID=478748 RepID=UPI0030D94A9B
MTDIVPLNSGPAGRRRMLKGEAGERTLGPDSIRTRWLGTRLKDLALIALSGLVLCAFVIWFIGLVNDAS